MSTDQGNSLLDSVGHSSDHKSFPSHGADVVHFAGERVRHFIRFLLVFGAKEFLFLKGVKHIHAIDDRKIHTFDKFGPSVFSNDAVGFQMSAALELLDGGKSLRAENTICV